MSTDWYVCRARDAVLRGDFDDEQYTDCIEKVGGEPARAPLHAAEWDFIGYLYGLARSSKSWATST